MPTSKSSFQTLTIDPRAGQRAFEELEPRLAALAPDRLEPIDDLDLSGTATHLLELSKTVATEPLRSRFDGLPLSEFNATNIDLIEKAAEALLFLDHRVNVERSRGADPTRISDSLRRVWTLLVEAYSEIRAAAQFLFRDEPERLVAFPPIGQLDR